MTELVSEFGKWCSEQCYREVEKTKVVINLKILLTCVGPHAFPGKKKGEFPPVVCQRCLMPTLPDKFICCKHGSSNLKFQWREWSRCVQWKTLQRRDSCSNSGKWLFKISTTHTLFWIIMLRKNYLNCVASRQHGMQFLVSCINRNRKDLSDPIFKMLQRMRNISHLFDPCV